MNSNILRHTLGIFGRKRKPRSRLYRITNRTLVVLGIAYLCLVSFPNFLFAHSVTSGQFDVHSDRPIPESIQNVLADVKLRIAESDFYSDEQRFDIYIVEDDWRRRVLNPRAVKASGAYFAVTNNIILNRCDIDSDICFNGLEKFNERPMHSVIAHECTHSMIRKKLGVVRAFFLPTWKHEGYCEYIAGNPSFGLERALRLLQDSKDHPSITFRYACWQLAVRHVLDDRGRSVDEMFATDLEFEKELAGAANNASIE